jgi:hypothetical protein
MDMIQAMAAATVFVFVSFVIFVGTNNFHQLITG